MLKRIDAGNNTEYLKNIEQHAKLTEKHEQIIKQQTAPVTELIEKEWWKMQELIKDLLLVTLGCGMGIITMCLVQAGKLADEKMETLNMERNEE